MYLLEYKQWTGKLGVYGETDCVEFYILICFFPKAKSALLVWFFWFVWSIVFFFFFFTLGSDFEVDYESEEKAQIVYSALAVDKEVVFHDASIQANFCFVVVLQVAVANFYFTCSCSQTKWKGRWAYLTESLLCEFFLTTSFETLFNVLSLMRRLHHSFHTTQFPLGFLGC